MTLQFNERFVDRRYERVHDLARNGKYIINEDLLREMSGAEPHVTYWSIISSYNKFCHPALIPIEDWANPALERLAQELREYQIQKNETARMEGRE